MADTVIKVESLSKKYIINHQKQEKYSTLRDSVANRVKSICKKGFNKGSNEEFWALRDLNFEIKQGDRVGIIGRNGAGKSTLLKVLSRITEPTSGKVSIKGRIASLLEVGTGFHPELTGRENIYLNGAILGMGKEEIKNKFDEIVEFAEVEKFLDTPVKRYSSGMYVRLAFSVAAHIEPEILIVDEVLAVGDAQFQKKCIGKMEEVGNEGRTVLFVSHNMSAISQLCTTGILLKNGAIEMNSSIENCVNKYTESITSRTEKIIFHGIVKSNDIAIKTIKINGCDSDVINLPKVATSLEIDIEGYVNKPTRVNIEAKLLDNLYNVIGIFSPAYMNENTKMLNEGDMRIKGKLELPKIIKGEYYINITIYDPGIKSIYEIPFAAKIIAEGYPTLSGLTFDKNMDVGSIIFLGESEYL